MTPIEAMVLAFEASGGDEPEGFEGRLLTMLLSLGWGLVPINPEYDGATTPSAHDCAHVWHEPDKNETFCRICGAIRKDGRRKKLRVLCSECEQPWSRVHECADGQLDDAARRRSGELGR